MASHQQPRRTDVPASQREQQKQEHGRQHETPVEQKCTITRVSIPIEEKNTTKTTTKAPVHAAEQKKTSAPAYHTPLRTGQKSTATAAAKTPMSTEVKGTAASTEEKSTSPGTGRTPMSNEEIGRYRAQAQQNSIDAFRQAEERLSKAKGSAGATEQKSSTERSGMAPMTNEEVGRYRAQAQQNSIEAIREAEERYSKAKEAAGAALKDTKETLSHGAGATKAYVAAKSEEIKEAAVRAAQKASEVAAEKSPQVAGAAKGYAVSAKDYAAQKTKEGLESAKDVAAKTKDYTTEMTREGLESAKDVAARTKDYTVQKGREGLETAKDYAGRTTDYAWEKGREGLEATKDYAGRTKDYAADMGREGFETTKDYAGRTKDYAAVKGREGLETTKDYAGYVGEKGREAAACAGEQLQGAARTARDVGLDTGRNAAGYVEDKARGAKEAAQRWKEEGMGWGTGTMEYGTFGRGEEEWPTGYVAEKGWGGQAAANEAGFGQEYEQQQQYSTVPGLSTTFTRYTRLPVEERSAGARGITGEGWLGKEHAGLRMGETRDTTWPATAYGKEEHWDSPVAEEQMRGLSIGEQHQGRYVPGVGDPMEEDVVVAGGGGAGGLLESVGQVVGETVAGIAQEAKNLLTGK